VALLALALVVLGQSKAVFDLGLMAWVSDRVPYEQRSRVIGINETSWALGLLVGVTAMGLITAATNYRVGYVVAAVAVSAASLACRRIAPDHAAHMAQRRDRQPVDRRRAAATMLGMYSLMAASQCVFITFGAWLVDRYDFSAAQLSAVTFGLGFCELFASTSSARKADRWGKEVSTAIGAALMVPSGIAVALGHHVLWVGLPFVIVAIASFEFAVVSALPLGTQLVPGSPARGVGLMFAAGTFGRASMSLLATRVYTHFGMTWPPLMTAVLAGCVVASMARLRRISR
jgi:predicted MFS family arabinose efflux permease